MARRSKYLQEIDPVPVAIEKHMVAMGFERSNDYCDWCWKFGFDTSLEKSKTELTEEWLFFESQAKERSKQSRLHKNPKDFLQAVCLGQFTADQIDRPKFKSTAAEIEASNEDEAARASLLDMLLKLLKHEDLIFETAADGETPLIRGLIKIHDRKALWLRSLDAWKPKSKNRDRKFGELTHHLFDQFGDVPQFMERVWLRNDRPSWRYRDWYVHLGRGHNLRTAKSPVPITKKIAHEFLSAPEHYVAEQAVRWGQMRALGASVQATDALVATRIGRSFENETFWITVIRFFADNPMLDPRQIGPIVDYLQNQRYQPIEIQEAPGQWRQEPPPQPGLTMRGRTVATLLRQVEDWHVSLGRLKDLPEGEYEMSNFSGFSMEDNNGRFWAIRQLRSAKDLQIESDELAHCVASYHWSCAKGHCTIWSLSMTANGKDYERRQTIEVDNHDTIVQCRGRANRDPKPEEWSVVNAWARSQGLRVAKYL